MFFYEYFRKCTPYEIQVRRADFMFNVCAQYSQTVSAIGGGLKIHFHVLDFYLPTFFCEGFRKSTNFMGEGKYGGVIHYRA